MQKLTIVGGKKLNGSINISGSKNATLPILAASILSKNKIIIQNIPLVKDVETMIDLLSLLGSKVKLTKKKKKIEILNNNKLSTFVPYKLVKTMRAGVLVLGPLLARYNRAKVSLPGGCAIGLRFVIPLISIFLFLSHLILHPILIKNLLKSFISGSHAQLLSMVLPLARQAAIMAFSVAPTEIFGKVILFPINPFLAIA